MIHVIMIQMDCPRGLGVSSQGMPYLKFQTLDSSLSSTLMCPICILSFEAIGKRFSLMKVEEWSPKQLAELREP